MRSWYWMAWAALLIVGCQADGSPPAEPPVAVTLPTVDTFTFDEMNLRGCGLTLRAPGAESHIDGLYLFSGLPDDPDAVNGSMFMKLDGNMVGFVRTETSGDALIGGQFISQTFVSQDGGTTVTVDITQIAPQIDLEVLEIDAATILLGQEGETLTLEAVGDTGC